MDLRQRLQDGDHQLHCFLYRDLPFSLQPLLQILSVQVLHHDIGRIILRKCIKDPDNARNTIHLRQSFCFIGKFRDPVVKLFLLVSRIDGNRCGSCGTGGKFTGKIFLYGHLPLHHLIISYVGHAKTTVTQYTSDRIFSFKIRSRCQMICFLRSASGSIPAVRADCKMVFIRFHASHASH